jgi:hypothetical protein
VDFAGGLGEDAGAGFDVLYGGDDGRGMKRADEMGVRTCGWDWGLNSVCIYNTFVR